VGYFDNDEFQDFLDAYNDDDYYWDSDDGTFRIKSYFQDMWDDYGVDHPDDDAWNYKSNSNRRVGKEESLSSYEARMASRKRMRAVELRVPAEKQKPITLITESAEFIALKKQLQDQAKVIESQKIALEKSTVLPPSALTPSKLSTAEAVQVPARTQFSVEDDLAFLEWCRQRLAKKQLNSGSQFRTAYLQWKVARNLNPRTSMDKAKYTQAVQGIDFLEAKVACPCVVATNDERITKQGKVLLGGDFIGWFSIWKFEKKPFIVVPKHFVVSALRGKFATFTLEVKGIQRDIPVKAFKVHEKVDLAVVDLVEAPGFTSILPHLTPCTLGPYELPGSGTMFVDRDGKMYASSTQRFTPPSSDGESTYWADSRPGDCGAPIYSPQGPMGFHVGTNGENKGNRWLIVTSLLVQWITKQH
jgi:hypothetical protein